MKMETRMVVVGALAALVHMANATTYYVNTNSWDDNYPGTVRWKPFKTLKRATSVLKSGDTLLLYRGSIWEEPLPVIAGVTYGDYGSGADKPIVRGSHDLSTLSWSSYGNGIYVASVSAIPPNASGKSLENVTQVFYGGARLYRARYPNLDVKYLQAAAESTSSNPQLAISPTDLPAGVDLNGAVVHAVVDGYYLRDFTVASTAQSGALYNLSETAFDVHFPGVMPYSNFSIKQGDRYWLENKLWMLDAENEWFYDEQQGKLYVKLPGGVSPQGKNIYGSIEYADTDTTGIYCASGACSGTTVQNIEVRETVGDGVFFKGGNNISLLNLSVTRPGGRGIALPGVSSSSVQGAVVSSSLREGIWMGEVTSDQTLPGTGVTVSNSTVSDAGRTLYAVAGIQVGYGNTISNNNVYRSAYAGILAAKDSTISGNYVEDACYEFGDCGAIYVTNSNQTFNTQDGYPLNVNISNNVINRTNLAASPSLGEKNGIYLDGMSRDVTVSGNFVQGVDNGLFGSFLSNASVSGNTFFKSGAYEVTLQEFSNDPGDTHPNLTSCQYYGLPCASSLNYDIGNVFSNNLYVHAAGVPAIRLYSAFGDVGDFGTFSQDRFVNLNHDRVVYERPGGSPEQVRTLLEWQGYGKESLASEYDNLYTDSPDPTSSSLIPNGYFETGEALVNGWGMYGDAAVNTVSSDCPPAGGSASSCNVLRAGLVDASMDGGVAGSKYFTLYTHESNQLSWSVSPGQVYLLEMDVKTNGQPIEFSASVSNGAGVAYAVPGTAALSTTGWQHITRRLYVNKAGGSSADPLRLQFRIQGQSGANLYLDNITLVADHLTGGNVDAAYSFVNASSSAMSFACPAVVQSLCGSYINAKTGASVSFPLSVPARSGMVVRLN